MSERRESIAPPEPVLAAYGLTGAQVARVSGGLINDTFFADRDTERVVVQRLHSVFGADVHTDIDAITAHLAARGLITPRLLRTGGGALWLEHAGDVWRALTYVDGVGFHKVPSPAHANAGFALVGRFHAAVWDLAHEFSFTRAGVHDTAGHLRKLRTVCDDALSTDILAAADTLPPLGDLPRRITHGDLKISNVLFERDAEPPRALCLIDLDTFGCELMAYELGDALRSWCNLAGEDVDAPAIDIDTFVACMRGYGTTVASLLHPAEIDSIVTGLETVCVELAARFCVDAVQDSYFGWDPDRFTSRREHNLVRSRGQLSLARSIAAIRDDLREIVATALDGPS